jgi:lysophospholipase L1-like esterase
MDTEQAASAELTPVSRRLRLLLLCGPGIVVIVAAVGAFLLSLRDSQVNFGKRKLLTFTAVGLAVAGAGALLHRKAVADLRATGRAYGKTVSFILVAVLVIPSLTILALDQAVGIALRRMPPPPLLIFPRHYRVSYKTPEFAFTAETNALGIRDHEVAVNKKDRLRILAVGDSYTYGWGVQSADSWVKVAERLLGERGREVEILNLGCPGTSVDAYALIAERAMPLLKPDLVLVAVLQGDDLKQLDLGDTTDRLFKFNGVENNDSSGGLLVRVLPNFDSLRVRVGKYRPHVVSAEQIQAEWKRLAHWIEDHLTPEERARFAAVDPEVKATLVAGDLNPWDVYFAVKNPDFMDFTLHPDRPDVRRAIKVMGACLERIKLAASSAGAKVSVVSVPAGWYTCAKALATRRRVGFRLDDSVLHGNAPDEAIASACRQADVEFHTFTARFREVAAKQDLYYELDGHFNTAGHALFGEQVADLLRRPK